MPARLTISRASYSKNLMRRGSLYGLSASGQQREHRTLRGGHAGVAVGGAQREPVAAWREPRTAVENAVEAHPVRAGVGRAGDGARDRSIERAAPTPATGR